MFCIHCGKSIDHEGNFCPHCGKKIAADIQQRPEVKKADKAGIKRFLFTVNPRQLSLLGLLLFLTGVSQQNSTYYVAGLIVMIMTFVCASTNDRIRGNRPSTFLRIALEIGGILLVFTVFLMQPNLYQTWQEEPIALFLLTVGLVAYINLLFKRYSLNRSTRIAVVVGSGIAVWFGVVYLTILIR